MPIAAAVVGVAAGAAAAGGVITITTAVVIGVVGGAVIGAAYAASQDEDIFKGALIGAVAGGVGVAGGYFGAQALGFGAGAAAPAGTEASAGVGGLLEAQSAAAPAAAISSTPAITSGQFVVDASLAPSVAGASSAGATSAASASQLAAAEAAAAEAAKATALNKALIYSSIGQGLVKGVGEVASSGGAENAVEAKAEADRATIAANQAGSYTGATANIKVPDWWNRYLTTPAPVAQNGLDKYKSGLLGGINGIT